jgi:hypothetical protein
MKSRFASIPILAAALTLAVARPGSAGPQAVILSPPISSQFVTLEPVSFDVTWTVTLSGSPLDHYATRIASQMEVQEALGLGNLPPTPAELQQYFGSQAPGFVGWDVHPPDQTTLHVEGLTPDQVYYLALTAVDQAGGYDGIFDASRNLLRFKPSTQLVPPFVAILSPVPSASGIVSVPEVFDVHWLATAEIGAFIDHSATLIVSQHDIQEALGLGSAPPSDADLQAYFGNQGPGYVGWTFHPPGETTQHVALVADGQVHYLALAAVDDIGGYVLFFSPSRNVLRFMTTGPVVTQATTWGAIKASRR